jgi:uncharacterized protein YjdB
MDQNTTPASPENPSGSPSNGSAVQDGAPVRKLLPHFFALLALFLISLVFWSCNTEPEDVYTVTFKLDSSRVGKFDSVLVQIYNGKASGPGDTNQAVQTEVVKLTASTKEITVQLNPKVKKDFSVVITGFAGKDIAYRNLHTVDGFTSPDSTKPAVLLVSRIQAEDLTLSVGETRAPSLTFEPSNAGDKRFVLVSKDSNIVKAVRDSLKGIKAGKAKVIASTPDFSVSIDFTVNVADVRVSELQGDSVFLKVGDTARPDIKVLPGNATDKDYSFESADTAILAVDGKSVVGRKAGKTSLVVSSKDGGAKDTLAVDVRIAVTGLKAKDMTVEVGDIFAPALEWTPSDATHQTYTLESKDSNNVAVRGDSLEAKQLGTVKVLATSKDGGIEAEFEVDVQKKVFHVKSVKTENLRALVGDTLAPKPAFDPDNASDKGYTLTSRDTGVAAVADGKLVAVKLGKAMIQLVTVDGGIKDSFELSVEPSNFKSDILPITSLKCAPCHEPGQTFNWQDSAQLVRKGMVAMDRLTRPDTAVGKMPLKGSPNGPLTVRELKVMIGWLGRVSIPLQSIAISDTLVNLGDTLVPDIAFTPANASNRIHTLTSSDTNVVAVRGDKLLPQSTGQATIDIETDEGAKRASFKVKVDPPSFQKNVLPITSVKCTPCHGPDQIFNWQDSVQLLANGVKALDRLQRDPNAAGKMPLKGAPNGDLTATELKILLAWLNAKVVPLKGITVPDDSIFLGEQREPAIIWNPANATNKAFTVSSQDTAKVSVSGTELIGKALGQAQIEVRSFEGGFSKFAVIKVIPIKVDSLAVRDTGCSINDSVYVKANFFPANATNTGFSLASVSVVKRVKIDSGFKVTALVLGKDTLEATSADGGKKTRFVFNVGPVAPKSFAAFDTSGTIAGALVKPRLLWNPTTTTDKRFLLSVTTGDTLNVAAVRDSLMLPRTATGQVTVTATSIADPTIKATFKFSVGPVPVIGISMAATTQFASTATPATATFFNARPFITWNPLNATDKRFTLVSSAPTKVQVLTDSTVSPLALGTTAVTVKSLSDTSIKATWSVTVVRPLFTGTVKTIFTNKCGQCHGPVAWPTRNWQDSTQVVSFRALINTRIHATDGTIMPQPGATNGPLTAPEIATLTAWLNVN